MDPEHIPSLLNLGVGGVTLYLYLRLFTHVTLLTEELRQAREEQWELIKDLVGADRAAEVRRRINGS